MFGSHGGVGGSGGKFLWVRNQENSKANGIVAVLAWGSITEPQLNDYARLYSSLGWNVLLCLSDFLNIFIPERATAFALSVVSQLVEELRLTPCPLVFASLSGGSQACLYKIFQVIDGGCEVMLSPEESRLVKNCVAGHLYDSGPVDFTRDLGARFSLHQAVLKLPGSSKLVSLIAKGVTSGLDALFITRFGSHRTDYWRSLCSAVGFGAPFLFLCSECDDLAPYPVIFKFSQRLQDAGGSVKVVKWKDSPHVGHYKNDPSQYRAAVEELLDRSLSVFSHKIERLGEQAGAGGLDSVPDVVSDLICDLQNAAVNSNQGLKRVAVGPGDHLCIPSSVGSGNGHDSQPSPEDKTEKSPSYYNPRINAHGVLGQILFDACVPKTVEGWDIKFSGSLNGQPLASASRQRSPPKATNFIRRSRL
ncbi:OLC1v1003012C1 [Oldenlandia corymbosa var. corymbosa]|uniref:OLC1v1003012C1 n=1 Tax=Oldenlandia corymbosa var. corymbosa TaxID=529605 RepID=A0AAV1DC01_OLDCO|nr:OLC1v1003012C1 [Oldenlandia corymbosa var. corymbosa]